MSWVVFLNLFLYPPPFLAFPKPTDHSPQSVPNTPSTALGNQLQSDSEPEALPAVRSEDNTATPSGEWREKQPTPTVAVERLVLPSSSDSEGEKTSKTIGNEIDAETRNSELGYQTVLLSIMLTVLGSYLSHR